MFTKSFISIHALREEGDVSVNPHSCTVFSISIHALREEGDVVFQVAGNAKAVISIHALREEGDFGLRGRISKRPNFYPRPPRGGRHQRGGLRAGGGCISIHALREEGDSKNRDKISIFL